MVIKSYTKFPGLDTFDGVIFDLDGTVYLGDRAIPGAVDCIQRLRQMGKKVLFISNKPIEPRARYAAKLTRLGIPTPEEDVINSAFVLGHYLASHLPDKQYYVVGEERLRQEMRSYGLTVVDEFTSQDAREVIDPTGIDAVIVAFDRTLDYRKLNTAYQALVHGARFFATNADATCPVAGGAVPDAGATIAYLELSTGRKLELLGGKPSVLMMDVARQLLQLPAPRCLLVGDRLETDMRMGQQAGFRTALVLSGVTRIEDLESVDKPPDYVLRSIAGLFQPQG